MALDPTRVAASIRAANVNVLVACIHENIAGFAIMRYGTTTRTWTFSLWLLPIDEQASDRRLLLWLEKCAVVAGISSVTLEVRAGNEGAQLFYQRMGYRPLAHVPGYYQGIEAALRMRREWPCRSPDSDMPGTQIFRVDKTLERIFGSLGHPKGEIKGDANLLGLRITIFLGRPRD